MLGLFNRPLAVKSSSCTSPAAKDLPCRARGCFGNRVATGVVTGGADGTSSPATATVGEGAARDALWDRHVAEHRLFAEYPSKTDRVIPIARLTPLA